MSNLMKICPVGAELFHAEWWTDMAKLMVNFRNFANAPKNQYVNDVIALCSEKNTPCRPNFESFIVKLLVRKEPLGF
jgi:hypothetical protein